MLDFEPRMSTHVREGNYIYSRNPPNAPFSVEQRAWLNGFLAGMLGGGTLVPGNNT